MYKQRTNLYPESTTHISEMEPAVVQLRPETYIQWSITLTLKCYLFRSLYHSGTDGVTIVVVGVHHNSYHTTEEKERQAAHYTHGYGTAETMIISDYSCFL